MVKHSDIMKIGLTSLKYIAQRPEETKKGAVYAMLSLFSTLYYYYLVVIQLANMNGDIGILAKCIESLASFSQVTIKVIPLLIYRERLGDLMDNMKYFWDVDEFPSLIKENEKTFKISYLFQNIYRYTVFLTLLIFYTQPFFTKELLIICWIPEYPYAFEILLVGEYIYAFFVACFMTGFDNVYVSFCTHLIVQLRIVNSAISDISLNDKDYIYKLRTCVEHHRFLLKFATEMLKIYSISMLGQYVLSIYLTCMELYLFTESFGSFERIVLSTSYLSCLMFQMALYCFPATEVADEASLLAESIYNSNWYDGPISRQKNVILIMLRAQKEFVFTAGGLADINREAFTVVFKTSMSFFTLLQQLKEK